MAEGGDCNKEQKWRRENIYILYVAFKKLVSLAS